MFRRSTTARARKLTADAAQMLEADRPGAEKSYRAALQLDPELKEAWFDLGLICKWERRWQEAFDCNLRAAELEGAKADEPAWWNLGIAATALRDWQVARRAWRAYRLKIPDGEGPIEGDFGVAPVRLNRDDAAEVVWGHRIDPARIRLSSIPFPQSGHRWADVVLHDGVPNGYREFNGQSRAVFDELMRWEPSEVSTIQVSVSADEIQAVDELLEAVHVAGYAGEDWTRNVRALCKRCSEGTVHAEHSEPALASGREHFIGFAGPFNLIDELVERWAVEGGRQVHSVEQVF